MEAVNKQELKIVGLSRSGNHAIINWIIHQIQGSYCFLNCAEPKLNPYFSARPLDRQNKTYQTNIDSFCLESEQNGIFSKKDFLLYSYEDCFLGTLKSKIFRENRHSWIGKSMFLRNILILRDPFNLFASRTKSGLLCGHYNHHGVKPISLLTLKRLYKQHAKEFLKSRKSLNDLIPINFNRWAADRAYRETIVEQIQISFTDDGFKEVNQVVGGSSFDGITFAGSAEKMKVNDRWRHYKDDEAYWQLFDEEIVNLTVEIFGMIPPVRHYLQRKETPDIAGPQKKVV